MVWSQLAINKPHLAYLIIGGFTSLFMLCSLFVKERLYIGEATVATICGVIFGPYAANLFNPLSWGNVDQITLECSRVVLVVQCFAVGVELPKAYMERHWRSVVLLLVPVMTFGWLITSLFIWWMIVPLTWLESLMCAACVTATDPVLASSVVGKGKFAKRVPKHLRDLLSAESGCNDGMAFPFIYLSYYLIHFRPNIAKVSQHWFCNTILYECIFGAVYGVTVGYLGRHAIKLADRKGLIDRESFLVFYFVLALFCAGSGSLLGMDDLLVGFAAGVGFSNDGWFTHKTEESHVSNVIDLLLNLAYFVYLGAIIPWSKFNAPEIGLTPWRLVVIAILVIFFRRIPIMLILKPLIPDMKTWREALFAGHFGPIGVGAIFAALLSRAELTNDTTTPSAVLPGPGAKNYLVIQVIWPLTTFLVITSIVVHGSSIAVFTLGKHINTLTLTMSYTQADENGPSWMNRLPRIATTSRAASFSKSKGDDQSLSSVEKLAELPPGSLPPVGVPGTFLRRQRDEDGPAGLGVRPPISRPSRRRKWDSGMGPGGPISRSAIAPQRRTEMTSPEESASDTWNEKSSREDDQEKDGYELQHEARNEKLEAQQIVAQVEEPVAEVYLEGHQMIIEDEEGNVLETVDTRGETDEQKADHVTGAVERLRSESSGEHSKSQSQPHEKRTAGEAVEDAMGLRKLKTRLGGWNGRRKKNEEDELAPSEPAAPERKRGAAHAYQFGSTIILEDDDGEVIKKIEIPVAQRIRGRGGVQDHANPASGSAVMRDGLKRMGEWASFRGKAEYPVEAEASMDVSAQATQGPSASASRQKSWVKTSASEEEEKDDGMRFTVTEGGRRMSQADLIRQIQQMDPKHRSGGVRDRDAPETIPEGKQESPAGEDRAPGQLSPPGSRPRVTRSGTSYRSAKLSITPDRSPGRRGSGTQDGGDRSERPGEEVTLVESASDIPVHSVPDSVNKYAAHRASETAAERRRRMARDADDSDDDGTVRTPPFTGGNRGAGRKEGKSESATQGGETHVERRRRLAALEGDGNGSDSDDDGGERKPGKGHAPVAEPGAETRRAPGIRFAEVPTTSVGRVQWGEGVGTKVGKRGGKGGR
jgi:NhaP-type Na+/H+ or K+/H+ antiporter